VELERAAAGVGEGRQADFEHAWAAHCRVITTARYTTPNTPMIEAGRESHLSA
jgi:hypothetical protein